MDIIDDVSARDDRALVAREGVPQVWEDEGGDRLGKDAVIGVGHGDRAGTLHFIVQGLGEEDSQAEVETFGGGFPRAKGEHDLVEEWTSRGNEFSIEGEWNAVHSGGRIPRAFDRVSELDFRREGERVIGKPPGILPEVTGGTGFACPGFPGLGPEFVEDLCHLFGV